MEHARISAAGPWVEISLEKTAWTAAECDLLADAIRDAGERARDRLAQSEADGQ